MPELVPVIVQSSWLIIVLFLMFCLTGRSASTKYLIPIWCCWWSTWRASAKRAGWASTRKRSSSTNRCAANVRRKVSSEYGHRFVRTTILRYAIPFLKNQLNNKLEWQSFIDINSRSQEEAIKLCGRGNVPLPSMAVSILVAVSTLYYSISS